MPFEDMCFLQVLLNQSVVVHTTRPFKTTSHLHYKDHLHTLLQDMQLRVLYVWWSVKAVCEWSRELIDFPLGNSGLELEPCCSLHQLWKHLAAACRVM